MNKHHGIKVLTASVVLVVILVLSNSRPTIKMDARARDPNNFNEAITSQFNDNVRDVSARLQETEKKLAKLQGEYLKFQERTPQPNPGNNKAVNNELLALKKEIRAIKDIRSNRYPVENTSTEDKVEIKDLDDLLDKRKNDNKTASLWSESKQSSEQSNKTPYYTIPQGSDFSKVTLLSALIGEVPVEGKLMQPLFPFSAIVSRGEQMSANGIDLPDEIIGMKISGYAIGVGSFLDSVSCARAYVTSVLFVFEDGHFVTVGKEQMKSSAELINNDSLGYLTTQYGNPCIKGRYITNAQQVLTSMMAAHGIQGAGQALSKWQMSYQSEGPSILSKPTGNIGHFAAGGAISEGSQRISEWLEKRVQGSFDMVFVPASIKSSSGFKPNQLSLHFSQTIAIDKSSNGRELDYGHHQIKSFDNALR
jgi:integrating conjugative element protein (TIGR03752 family)